MALVAMFDKVLVANRGEIALRIIRTLREMAIHSVAVFSDADRDAPFVGHADESYRLGPAAPAESYLNANALLEIAKRSGAEAVHPGYGFLAENFAFAQQVLDAGLTWIGPSPAAMQVMGDKVMARRAVAGLGVPLVPGTSGPVANLAEANDFVHEHGFPVVVKAAGGGGGRGMRVVEESAALPDALESARREAQSYFNNPEVYIERYFDNPRHVEVQVLGDTHGTLIHLGERDCSTQRRHQKLIEETPSPAVSPELRARLGAAAVRAAVSAKYSSAGTVEFLLARDGAFYFLEMNTRIQVEHPVTEMVTGVDLIREMILIAAGERMTLASDGVNLNGHAIEARINAENAADGFRPTPTRISEYIVPGGPGIRVDSGVNQGFVIPAEYDSLMTKLIAWAPDREQARRRLLGALGEYSIAGPATTIPFISEVIRHPEFVTGEVGTRFVEKHLAELVSRMAPAPKFSDAIPANAQPAERRQFDVEVNRKLFAVTVSETRPPARSTGRVTRPAAASGGTRGKTVVSPMHGTIIAIRRERGDVVNVGDVLFVVEAMKMENEVAAHRAGTLSSLTVSVGDTVESGQALAAID